MAPITKTFTVPPDFNMDDQSGDRVVISGMAGLYPESHNVKDLSNILYNKINPINADSPRWKYDHPEVAQYTGKVPELKLFDAQFFKVHYRLGNNMDSMGRKILEQAYQAIYDAGISPSELNGKKVGVYVGSCFSETEKACFYVASSRTGFGIAGCSKTMFANRVSYWLNAKGPSMAIDEACSSSVGALELAYLAITRGECEAAIVGGANLCLHPQSSVHYGRIMKLSMDGKTKSFDNNPEGCAKSEAINVLFLQKAKDALRIYAEVVHVKCEFTSLPEDERGPRYGFYRNPSDTANFIKRFYEETTVKPEAVEYVEAFGSAVSEADKAELEAIEEVYCKNRSDPLLIGSVMSNIGYAEAASGISAITKVLLGYHTGKLAANLHCELPRQDVTSIREGRMRVLTEHQSFGRKYTAVNGLSVTGVNTHVLLNGHYKPKDPSRYKSNIPQLVTISGRQESSVKKIFDDLKSRPIDPEELALFRNIHKTSIFGHLGRGYIMLDTNEQNETITICEKADYFDDAKRPLWFVYSGMGSQWAGMGAQLMRIPIFAASIERCRRALEPKGIDIVQIITSPDKTTFDNILNSFVGIAAVQIGLTDILREMGIQPDNIIGHSVGELGCAYADGCFTAEEMILAAYSRGLVSLQTPFIKGSMAAVGVGYQQISKMCPPEIEVACHNGPDSSTISGPADIMKEFVADLTAKNIFAKEVPCSNIAYHSRYIAEAGPSLRKYLNEVIKTPKARSERWLSTSVPQDRWGEPLAQYSSAEYHTNNLLNSVLFEETSVLIPPNAVLVEIAPHGLLQAILKRSLPDSCRHIPLTRRGHPDNAQFLLEAVGKLYMEGYNPKVEALYPKIEYPVSTGTPMLSHLVEWAHNERWNLPLYVAAHRKMAAACKFVVSTQDDNNSYLKGHVIREKNMYPFAAVLVAVWDTLAMVLGAEKKLLPVEFHDVHQHSQLALYGQRQLRLSVALHRGTGRFEVLSNKTKIATGFIIGEVKDEGKIGHDKNSKSNDPMVLDSETIYQLFHSRDYNYSGEFRSIHRANLALTEADILWNDNWVTFIDGIIQLNALKRNYDSVSRLRSIRKIVIDVNNHLDHKTLLTDGAIVMKANVKEVHKNTSCGGVLMENLRFFDLPSPTPNVALKTVQFVPHLSKNKLDKTSALYAILQVAAENLNKRNISVVEVVDNKNNHTELEEIVRDIPGVSIQYTTVHRDDILKQKTFLIDVDVLCVRNLSTDDNLAQLLQQVRKRNSFLVSSEQQTADVSAHSLALYRTVCAHAVGTTRLELALWQPTELQGIWSGEYYLPILENPIKGRDMALEIKQHGDLESLHWVEASEPSDEGVDVKVHYAGINDVDMKKKIGVVALDDNDDKSLLDFSGVTKRGERVMGIVYDKSIKTTVRARPELLWPVPPHWSMEDAATVPLAYSLALYCLVTKGKFKSGINILVHGGAGALGQAVISIALAHNCTVFATVSDNKKKRFLLNLFPELKENHIGNSRDISFADMVLNATKGEGVHIVISCVRGEIKNASIRCCQSSATAIDTAVLLTREEFDFGMKHLSKGISYCSLNLYSILELQNLTELQELQRMVSEGIARGYVRPLSRVTYAPQHVARAYRLQAGSRHRGRVLIDFQTDPASVQTRLICSPKLYQLVLLENEVLGSQLVERLVKRGAKKIILITSTSSSYLSFKLRFWESQGVDVQILSQNVLNESVAKLFEKNKALEGIEGIYYVVGSNVQIDKARKNLEQLILTEQMSHSTLKHFAVINTDNDDWMKITTDKHQDNLPTSIKLPNLKLDLEKGTKESISMLCAVEAIEKALCSKQRVVVAHALEEPARRPLLQELASIAGVEIPEDAPADYTLQQLGVDPAKLELIRVFLRDACHIALDERDVQLVTVQEIHEIGESLSEKIFKETHGLETFISYIDNDELLATTEMVFLPTLTNISAKRDDEFDVNQTYLCVVPGVEGHHERYRLLCERLKLPAIVLQPGLDRPHESIQDLAARFAKTLLKKTKLTDGFYLLGCESGVMVALEMAAIFEDQGLTGTVFFVGGTPDEIQDTFEEKLKDLKTEDEHQDAVVRHMYTLLTHENSTKLDDVLQIAKTWDEKVSLCVKMVAGHVLHSNQYTKELIKAAYLKILQVRRSNIEPRQLRSQLILLRPRSSKTRSSLQKYSLKPVVEYQLEAPFAYAAQDLSCSALINRHLAPEILESFEKRNLCETYILNADSFMTNALNVDD